MRIFQKMKWIPNTDLKLRLTNDMIHLNSRARLDFIDRGVNRYPGYKGINILFI